jgi:hypothetical protein
LPELCLLTGLPEKLMNDAFFRKDYSSASNLSAKEKLERSVDLI